MHSFDIITGLDSSDCVRVPQVVKASVRASNCCCSLFESAVNGRVIKVMSAFICEDKVIIFSSCTGFKPHFCLYCFLALEQIHYGCGRFNSPTFAVFGGHNAVNALSSRKRCNWQLIRTVPCSKSILCQLRASTSPSHNPIKRVTDSRISNGLPRISVRNFCMSSVSRGVNSLRTILGILQASVGLNLK